MPRCWHIAAVVLLAWTHAAPSHCAAADEYGRRIDARSVATPQEAMVPPHQNLSHRSGSGQQPVQKPRGRRALRKPDPRESTSQPDSLRTRISGITGGKSISTVFGGLAIVLGTFFLLAWTVRRGMPKGAGRLPGEVVEILGRAPLAGKQTVQLVRLGNKLLLISLTPSGAETLAEVTDPNEVARIVGLCESTKEGSASVAFRQVFENLAKEQPKVQEDSGLSLK